MNSYKLLNIIGGWTVFIFAMVVYLMTIEPTVSFWDCGEYIATSNKLEVGHPPGAPLFMMFGRVFSAFSEPANVGYMVNVLSATCSALTIMFLFWTITYFGRKIALKNLVGEESGLGLGETVAILGSGLVGAIAFTFSDSFWFSAVEGEVYAMSGMFTAITFWAILKWEAQAHEKHADRWLILIAYLIGLSIGVHLLNLLCIPAIAMVYYYKRAKDPNLGGVVLTGFVSVLVLAIVQNMIIPGLVRVAFWFELGFVNGFGMPFHAGSIIFGILLIAAIIGLLMWAHRTNRANMATITLSFTVLVIGYSSFGMILVRSNANPPMDQNNPENFVRLISYLNREQYGTWPLLYGQYWNTPVSDYGDGPKVYYEDSETGNYEVSDDGKGSVPIYDKEFSTVFPRMWRSESNRRSGYKTWTNFKGQRKEYVNPNTGERTFINKPTFGENMSFFWNYQLGWMYLRYFAWNFVGRQNDIQGHGDVLKGNWISGVEYIDSQRLGPQDTMPEFMSKNKGKNAFYFLPLLLGLLGAFVHFKGDVGNGLSVFLLWFFTGIAIVVYLNQGPYEPRERDYAFAASFYAFAIWIGLGVYSLYYFAKNATWRFYLITVAGMVGFGIFLGLVELLFSGSVVYAASFGYMSTIAIIALGLMRLIGHYGKMPVLSGALALFLAVPVPYVMGAAGWDDHDRSGRFTARDMAKNYLDSCEPNAILFSMGDNDTFPLWYIQEVEGYRTDVRVVNLSYLGIDWYIDQMKLKTYESEPLPISLPVEKYRQGTRDFIPIFEEAPWKDKSVDIAALMQWITSEEKKKTLVNRERVSYMPTRKLRIPISAEMKDKIVQKGIVSPEERNLIVDNMTWEMGANKNYISKGEMVIMDMLANFNWDRPVNFTTTIGSQGYFGLQDYFQIDGFTYRLVPIRNQNATPGLTGRVKTDVLYENLMNKFQWGGIENGDEIYLDHTNTRLIGNIRLYFVQLAEQLNREGKNTEAIAVLDRINERLPGSLIEHNFISHRIAELYYQIGETAKGDAMLLEVYEQYASRLEYFMSFELQHAKSIKNDFEYDMQVLGTIMRTAERNFSNKDALPEMRTRVQGISQVVSMTLEQLNAPKPLR